MQWIHTACQLTRTFACDRSQHTLQLMLMKNISFKSRHQKNNFLRTLSSKGSITQLPLCVSITSTKAKFLQFNLRQEKHHYFRQAFQIKTGKWISHDSRSGLLHWPRALCRHNQFPWSHLEQFKGHLWLNCGLILKYDSEAKNFSSLLLFPPQFWQTSTESQKNKIYIYHILQGFTCTPFTVNSAKWL